MSPQEYVEVINICSLIHCLYPGHFILNLPPLAILLKITTMKKT